MATIARKFMAHYIGVGSPKEYYRLGKDLEEFNIEMNTEIETKANILGESNTIVKSYSPQASVEPYIAEQGEKVFEFLQDIIDERKTNDACKCEVIEVHLWESAVSGAYPAYKEDAIVEVSSYGGDTTGYQIPFNIHYVGNRVKGTFNPTTKAFTQD